MDMIEVQRSLHVRFVMLEWKLSTQDLHQTPEQIVATAVQEDVDAIGLSILSGAHIPLFSRTLELLKAEGAKDVLLFGGGIIPDADIATLKEMGVSEIFTPGTPSEKIVEWVRANVKGRN